MLTINKYNESEQQAEINLSARQIAAFSPVTFGARSYPIKVSSEQEIARYIDTMHDTKSARYFIEDKQYSTEEGKLVSNICSAVGTLSEIQFKKKITPWMAPPSCD